MKLLDRGRGLRLVGHLNKSESTRAAVAPERRDLATDDFAGRGEHLTQLLLRPGERKISDIKLF